MRCHSLVVVNNPSDYWCLSRAIIIGMRYRQLFATVDGPAAFGNASRSFAAFCNRQYEHRQEAGELLRDSGCALDKTTYGLEDVRRIQQLLDERFGANEVRIVIFRKNKIVFKGTNPRPARFNLCLLLENCHFSFIGRPEQLFKVCVCVFFDVYLQLKSVCFFLF